MFEVSVAPVMAPRLTQGGFCLALTFGIVAGLSVSDPAASTHAIAAAGAELTRLLRFMVVVKALLVAGASAAVLWRLRSPIPVARFGVYSGLAVLMAAGLGEIWQIAGVGQGALMLHGGLVAIGIMLWRDPELQRRLAIASSRR